MVGELLQGKWVDVNKGHFKKPVVRSRYVAKEFANTKSDNFFSPTPPLEALRLLLSHAASGRSSSTGGRKILVVDLPTAHLHAFAERNLYVALPPEVRVPWVCARLRRSLRGTRDAPAMWEASLSQQLKLHGMCERVSHPVLLSAQQQRSELRGPRRRLRICCGGNRLGVGSPSDGDKLPCQSPWSPANKTCTSSDYSTWPCPGTEVESSSRPFSPRDSDQRTGAGRAWALHTWSEEAAEEKRAWRRRRDSAG